MFVILRLRNLKNKMPKFGLSRPLGYGPFRPVYKMKKFVRRPGAFRGLRGAAGTRRYQSSLATKIQKVWRGRHSRLKNPLSLFKKYKRHPLLGSARLKYGGGYGVNSFRYQR